MDSLINFDGLSDVANNLIDKISAAAGWLVTRETPGKIAVNTYIKDIQESNLDPISKAVLITNAKKTIKEYSNQLQIIQKAIPLLNEESDPNNLDEDWLNEFMDKARLVSDEEFQIVWAKILAGEVDKKNSFSIRTLNKVKSMSKKEAETFSKVARLALGNNQRRYIVDDKGINEKYEINLEDIIVLEECGMMSSKSLSLTTTVVGPKASAFEDNDTCIGMIKSKDGSKIEIVRSIYVFTQSGKELLNAVITDRDENYLLDALKMIKEKYKTNDNIAISVHRVISREGENIRYHLKDMLVD